MFRRTCHALLVCTPVVLLAGCKTAQPIQRSITVTYAVPAFHFEPETRAVQKLGGITMQLAPVTYRVEERVRETKHNLRHSHARVYDPRLKRSVETGEVITNFDSIQTPYYAVEPSHVTFHVKITNQLDHVLRLAGSVVVFNVNGQVISVPQKNYSKLANAIVPRGQELEVTIVGPDLDSLPVSGTIGISVDDVVVAVDDAGTAVKRAHFEWVLKYARPSVSKTVNAITIPMRQVGHAPAEPVQRLAIDPDNPLIQSLKGKPARQQGIDGT